MIDGTTSHHLNCSQNQSFIIGEYYHTLVNPRFRLSSRYPLEFPGPMQRSSLRRLFSVAAATRHCHHRSSCDYSRGPMYVTWQKRIRRSFCLGRLAQGLYFINSDRRAIRCYYPVVILANLLETIKRGLAIHPGALGDGHGSGPSWQRAAMTVHPTFQWNLSFNPCFLVDLHYNPIQYTTLLPPPRCPSGLRW